MRLVGRERGCFQVGQRGAPGGDRGYGKGVEAPGYKTRRHFQAGGRGVNLVAFDAAKQLAVGRRHGGALAVDARVVLRASLDLAPALAAHGQELVLQWRCVCVCVCVCVWGVCVCSVCVVCV